MRCIQQCELNCIIIYIWFFVECFRANDSVPLNIDAAVLTIVELMYWPRFSRSIDTHTCIPMHRLMLSCIWWKMHTFRLKCARDHIIIKNLWQWNTVQYTPDTSKTKFIVCYSEFYRINSDFRSKHLWLVYIKRRRTFHNGKHLWPRFGLSITRAWRFNLKSQLKWNDCFNRPNRI